MPTTHARLHTLEELTPSILRLTFTPESAVTFPAFLPGQYATIRFPAFRRLKAERSFSIASSAVEPAQLEFGIRVGGPYTAALRSLQPGDHAVIASPYGDFTFHPDRDQSAVLLAGGIGVTPFLSMIRTATDQGLPNDITLLYSIRSISEAAYQIELDALQRANPHFHLVYIVGDGKIPADDPRYVAGRLTPETLAAVPQHDVTGRSWFLCGPPAYMSAATKMLRDLGLPVGHIRRERFAVASSAIIEPGSIWPKITFATWGVAASVVFATMIRIERDRRLAVNAAANSEVTPTVANSNSNTNTEPITNTAPTPVNTATVPPVTNSLQPTVNTSTPVNTATLNTTPKPTNTYKPPVKVNTTPTPVPTYRPRTTVS